MAAIGLVACAFVFKPELLRSEQHVLRMTMASIIGDSEMEPAARERLSHAVLDAVDRRISKAAVYDSGDRDDAEGDQ